MSLLIKNGRIITADSDYHADIFIEGEVVKTIGINLTENAEKVIDATGKLIFPGGIDPHVHLEMPFMGTFSSDTLRNRNPGCFVWRHNDGYRFYFAKTRKLASVSTGRMERKKRAIIV